jgi:hypothetical protein
MQWFRDWPTGALTITRRRQIVATFGLALFALVLHFVTGNKVSIITIVLPGAAVYWMIARERRVACEEKRLPSVPWPTRLALFGVLPGFSMGIILFWLPHCAPEMNPWVKYSGASFCLGLVLAKAYERFLLARRRASAAIEKTPERPIRRMRPCHFRGIVADSQARWLIELQGVLALAQYAAPPFRENHSSGRSAATNRG